ncbi:MAG TPA: Fic family protein [Thermoanaerobaculia bacterium]|nr:Fic family protein [Thermoanaerobaculia bacterium]
MRSFQSGYLDRMALPPGVVWQLTEIAEARARRSLLLPAARGPLVSLGRQARVETVISSNRIEGVVISADRVEPLLNDRAAPRDHAEEEVKGYQDALDLVWSRPPNLAIGVPLLLELHRRVLPEGGDGGSFKLQDNEIVELEPGRAPRVRFRALPAGETPEAVAELCREYEGRASRVGQSALVAIAALILDFLCIHPFRDGNGRVSRLLTLLVLDRQGHDVGRFVSLDRLIEQELASYYAALEASSAGWHEGRHDLVPWLTFFLSVLRRAYQELAANLEQAPLSRTKTERVEAAIAGLGPSFTLREILEASPGVSRELVRQILRRLRREGRLEAVGRGPGAVWRKR